MNFGHILAILLYLSQGNSAQEILDLIKIRIVTGSDRLTTSWHKKCTINLSHTPAINDEEEHT
jgi:hypothetical protein